MYDLPLADGRRVTVFAKHVASVEPIKKGLCVIAMDNNQRFNAAVDFEVVTKVLQDLVQQK